MSHLQVVLLMVVVSSSCAPLSEHSDSDVGSDVGDDGDDGARDGEDIWVPQQPEGWDAAVRIAQAEDFDPAPDVVEFFLEAQLAEIEIQPGVLTTMWTYNGQVPGPTLRAKRGDHVIVHVVNSLPEDTTVHWHGLRVPAEMDGTEMMQAPILPGGDFTYEFDLIDVGTYWYHPHVNASAQVGFGLYGAFIVDDPAAPDFGDELVLITSDVSLDDDGQLLPADDQGWFGDYFGRQGQPLLNGKILPHLGALAQLPQHWRVINAARAHIANFAAPGTRLERIAVDGGPVEFAAIVDSDVIAPGARREFRFVPPEGPFVALMMDLGTDNFHIGQPPPVTSLAIIDIAASSDGTLPPPLTQRLSTIAPISIDGATAQSITFDDVVVEGQSTVLGINGEAGMDSTPLVAQTDSVEVWTLTNTTSFDHPFHMHGFFFQILDEGGVAPPSAGWYDTVLLPPQVPVRIAIAFDDRAGMWMVHCHILDHSDLGMMKMLDVVDGAASAHGH